MTEQQDFLQSLKDPNYAVEKGILQAMSDLQAQYSSYIKSTEVHELSSVPIYHIDIHLGSFLKIDLKDSIKYHIQKYNKKAVMSFHEYVGPQSLDKFYIVVKV